MESNSSHKSQQIVSEFRYERKMWFNSLSYHEALALIKLHPYLFTEIHHARHINNIYFDTVGYSNYFNNVDGLSDRIKVRIRWYGKLFGRIVKPVLELKIKKGLLGKKVSLKLDSFILEPGQVIPDVLSRTGELESYGIDFGLLKPALLNRYERRYFQSSSGNFRLTIDSDQSFYEPDPFMNRFLNRAADKDSVILELKYATEFDNEASRIISAFPFRMTKSSKYVTGLQRIHSMPF